MAMNPVKKQALEAMMENFLSNCRFLKVTDKMLYEDLLKSAGVKKHWSYEVFKTSLHTHPTCILNKDIKIHKLICEIHQELLLSVKNKNATFIEE